MACKVKTNRHGNLAFRFYWNGREFWQGTDWNDTPKNRTKAEGKAVEITEEMPEYIAAFKLALGPKGFAQINGDVIASDKIGLTDYDKFLKEAEGFSPRSFTNVEIPLQKSYNRYLIIWKM